MKILFEKKYSYIYSFAKLSFLTAFISLFSTVLTTNVLAKQPQPSSSPFSVQGALFMSKQVQRELELKSDQTKVLEELYSELLQNDCTVKERLEDPNFTLLSHREIREKAQLDSLRVQREMMQTLRATQRMRWREILLQTFGLSALTKPDMIKALDITLGLTKEQKLTLEKLGKKAQADIDTLLKEKKGQNQVQLLMKDIGDKVFALLNDEQRTILKKMRGKKFQFQGRLEAPSLNKLCAK